MSPSDLLGVAEGLRHPQPPRQVGRTTLLGLTPREAERHSDRERASSRRRRGGLPLALPALAGDGLWRPTCRADRRQGDRSAPARASHLLRLPAANGLPDLAVTNERPSVEASAVAVIGIALLNRAACAARVELTAFCPQ